MASTPPPDLPPPQIVESLDFAAIVAELRVRFARLCPEYDAFLESDPAQKLLEVAAYREMLLRARINDAARARLVAFAAGTDLDHVGDFYGVVRLTGEGDTALRDRIRARITGFSSGGTVAAYRYHALSSHPGIENCAIFPARSGPEAGTVVIALLPRPGADQAALLAAATAHLNDDAVRAACDTLTVRLAVAVAVPVTADITLQPQAPASRLDEIAATFRTELLAVRALGRDVTRSWIIATLQRPDVHSVRLISPDEDVTIAPDAYPETGAVTLSLTGRAY